MKNTLKKIGVFGLICAILSPFASLPKVNADDNCQHYLNQYLFLDPSTVQGWDVYNNGGYTTYTSFLYDFPKVSSGEKIVIESLGEYPLQTKDALETYHGYVKLLIKDSSMNLKDIEKSGEIKEQTFTNSEYKSITAFLHGYWNKEGETTENAGWKIEDNANTFVNQTIQGNLINANKIDKLNLSVKVGGAVYNEQDKSFSGAGAYTTDVVQFLQTIVDDVNSNDNNSEKSGYIYKDENGKTYLNFRINREMDKKQYNNFNFGDKKQLYVWSTSADKITESYKALENYMANESVHSQAGDGNLCASSNTSCYKIGTIDSKKITESDIDFDATEGYLWPVIYNIKYSICQTSSTGTTGKWSLTYKEGVEDTTTVTNMPNPKTVSETVGTDITVSDTKPSREGFAFNGWKLCNGNDTYKAGDKVKNSEADVNVELCAQWGEEGTEENKGTGVISYVIGFAAVGLVAGAIYLVSKKKNFFKQI